MAFKMKGSAFYGKGNQSGYNSALKHVSPKVHTHEGDDKKVTTRNGVAVADPTKTSPTVEAKKSKSVNQVLYDKASQVGMGVREAWGAMTDDKKSQLRLQGGHADLNIKKHFNKGFQKEKAKDNAND